MPNKIKFFLDTLEKIDQEYVLFLDGYDVLLTHLDDILDKYLKTVYDINNAFFTPHRLHLAPFNTSNRPSEKMEGMVIYDLNLKKPIVWNGTNWTDFIGNIV